MEGENGLDQVGDAGGTAAELARQPPGFEGGHGPLAESADSGMGDVDSALALGQLLPAAPVGNAHGAAGTLVALAAQRCTSNLARASMMPCVRAALMSRTAPGRAGEAHSRRPNGSAMTCTFIPYFLCFPE